MPIPIVALLWQLFERKLRDLAFLEECMNYSLLLYNIVPSIFEKVPCELINLIGQKLAENHDDKGKWYIFIDNTTIFQTKKKNVIIRFCVFCQKKKKLY